MDFRGFRDNIQGAKVSNSGLYIANVIFFLIATGFFLVIGPVWSFVNFMQDEKTRFNHKFMWFLAMIFWPFTQMAYSHKAKHTQLIWLFRISSVIWLLTLIYLMMNNVDLQQELIQTRIKLTTL